MQFSRTVLCVLASLLGTTAAFADNRYVNKSGTDSGTCGATNATACLTISTAVTNATTAGGFNRIIITSNGGFQEAVTLTTSTEIIAVQDVQAIIAPPSGQNAITVNGGTSDTFRFFNLYLAGSTGAALDAVQFNSGARLELHNLQIRGFGGTTINFKPSGGTAADLLIDRSEIADSINAQCVLIQPSGMTASAVVSNSLIHNCKTLGLRVDSQNSTGFNKATVVNTRVFSIGVTAVSSISTSSSGNARVYLEDSQITNAVNGVVANGANSVILMNRSSINGTTNGMVYSGGQIFSYGTNALYFNSANGAAPTQVPLQ